MMKSIPSFEDFERIGPLEQKIKLEEAEKLAELFASQEGLNESNFLDSIKNTLSKTFLGSLSYLNMIDKVRSEVVKLKKELVTKRYSYMDELASLKGDIKDFTKSKNEAGIQRTEKTISTKKREFEVFEKMIDNRIQKAMDTLKGIVKGSKRRMEYLEAGESADELEILEFEYQLLKQRSDTPEEQAEVKKMEKEIQKTKEEADKAKKDLESKAEDEKESNDDGISTLDSPTPDYNKILLNKESRKSLILKLKNQIAKLEDQIEDSEGFNKGELQRTLSKVKKDLLEVKKVHNQLGDKKIIDTEKEFSSIIKKLGKELKSTDAARQKVSKSTIQTKAKKGNIPSKETSNKK